MRRSKDAWILIVLFLGLVVGGIFFARPESKKESDISTTYNPGKAGVKAFYTLLSERLSYATGRLEKPYTRMPRKARVLIVVQPVTVVSEEGNYPVDEISAAEREHLLKWIKRGGVAIFLADDLQNVPAALGSTRQLGKGFIYAFNFRKTITNAGMRNYRNAVDLLTIIDRHASKRDLVLFDEYHHGIGQEEREETLLGVLLRVSERPMKFAFAVLMVAGLALLHTKARRFGAIRRLPSAETVRPGYEFVESVARLYKRAGAADAAGEILQGSFRHALCAKLGLAGDASIDAILSRLGSGCNDDLRDRISRALTPAGILTAGQKLSEPELLNMAREIQRLEQELGLGGNNA